MVGELPERMIQSSVEVIQFKSVDSFNGSLLYDYTEIYLAEGTCSLLCVRTSTEVL